MTGIDRFGIETVDAISHLVKANRYLQALVILYSAIDTLAWASRKEGDVTRSDFCRWVSAYMTPESQLGCTPQDLYGARCGLLHSSGAQSKSSRKREASELWYATSANSVPKIQAFVQQIREGAKVLCITDIIDAFAQGVVKFSDEVSRDETRRRETEERIRLWLGFVPAVSLEP